MAVIRELGGTSIDPTDIYAIEVYQPPDIPPEYSHWYWGDIGSAGGTIVRPARSSSCGR